MLFLSGLEVEMVLCLIGLSLIGPNV